MAFLLLIVGFFLFILGLGYLFSPRLILRFNAFARDTFFKDSVVLLNNQRIGTILLLIAFVLIVFSQHSHQQLP